MNVTKIGSFEAIALLLNKTDICPCALTAAKTDIELRNLIFLKYFMCFDWIDRSALANMSSLS